MATPVGEEKAGMRTWYSAVVLALKEKGSKGVALQDIYDAVGKFRPLSTHDTEPHPKYTQKNYEHKTRRCLKTLKDFGLVEHIDRGVYSLTPKSIKHLRAFEEDSKGRRGPTDESFRELLKGLGIE